MLLFFILALALLAQFVEYRCAHSTKYVQETLSGIFLQVVFSTGLVAQLKNGLHRTSHGISVINVAASGLPNRRI